MTALKAKPGLSANLVGALWIVAAGFFGSTMGALAKSVGFRLGPVEIAFFRAFIGFAITLPFILHVGRRGWRTAQPLLQILRGVSASLIMLFGFYALIHLSLADVTVIAFSKALFVVILARFVLRETVRLRRTLATMVGFIGVLVIMRPTGTIAPAALIALAGAALIAMNIMLVKVLTRTDAPATLVLYSNIIQTLVLVVPAAYYWVTPTWTELTILISVGVLGTLVQICIVRGYAVGDASAIVPFDYLRILFAVALGYVFFDEVPDAWTWAGAAIIAGSTLYIARREARLGKPLPEPQVPERVP